MDSWLIWTRSSEYKGRRAGSIGDIGCFSFYPGKNLGAYGEGGALVCNAPEIAQRVALLRDWGQASKYNHVVAGYNYRMDGIQGAILNVKMNYIEEWTESRRRVASQYDRLLEGYPYRRPASPSYSRHVYHVYAIELDQRDAVQAVLQSACVGTGIHYPVPVHLQKAYAVLGYVPGDLPVTEFLASRLLSLPIYAELRPDQVATVISELQKAVLIEVA
jgi:dTDP-4-amino-4,6-dideoxygalactose transaminase